MDSSTPNPQEACTGNGSLRLAILLLAMMGYMTLWSAMQGDLPESEVTLARQTRLMEKIAEIKEVSLITWSGLNGVSQSIQSRIQTQYQILSDSLAQNQRRSEPTNKLLQSHPQMTVSVFGDWVTDQKGSIRTCLAEVSRKTSELMISAARQSAREFAGSLASYYDNWRHEILRVSQSHRISDQKARR